jgi:hypothetical protein
METIENDVNNPGLVNQEQIDVNSQQTANTPAVDEGTGVNVQSAIEQKNESAVPYERFKEVNDKANKVDELATKFAESEKARMLAEAERELLKQQILASGQMKPQQPQQIPPTAFYLQRLGIDKDDVITGEQMIQIQEMQRQDYATAMQAQTLLAKHPDFNDVVGRINPMTRTVDVSEHLKKVLEKHPELNGLPELAMNNPAFAAIAYALANERKENELLSKNSTAYSEYMRQKDITNRTAAVSSAAVGGNAGSNKDLGNIENMNPESDEFRSLFTRIASGEFNQT